MPFSRRSFLKILGGAAAAAVAAPLITPVSAAPLFIPSQNLDMGVPRQILTATEMPTPKPTAYFVTGDMGLRQPNVPMLLVQDEFSPPGWQQYGQQKVPAGTTLLVDRPTAERWVTHGVGTPGPGAPLELQEASVKLGMTRRATSELTWANTYINIEDEGYDWAPGIDMIEEPDEPRYMGHVSGIPSWSTRQDPAIERASARLKGAKASSWWESIPDVSPIGAAPLSVTCTFGGDDA